MNYGQALCGWTVELRGRHRVICGVAFRGIWEKGTQGTKEVAVSTWHESDNQRVNEELLGTVPKNTFDSFIGRLPGVIKGADESIFGETGVRWDLKLASGCEILLEIQEATGGDLRVITKSGLNLHTHSTQLKRFMHYADAILKSEQPHDR